MTIFEIAVIALCSIILSGLLKKVSSEQGLLLSIASIVLILLIVLETAAPFIGQMKSIADSSGFTGNYLDILLKALGITVVGQITESICKDCGESALAYGVNIAAKIAVLMLSLPIISTIFDHLTEILSL